MDATLIGSILTFLTACVAGGRYLLGFYFKKVEDNEKLKFALTEKSIEALEHVIDNHRIILKHHSEKLDKNGAQMADMMGREEKTREAFGAIANTMRDYIESTKQRFIKLESEVINVSSELKIIKGAKNAKRSQ